MERRIDLNRLLEAAKCLETAAEYITAGAQQMLQSARILKSLCADALSDLSTSDDSHRPPASETTETADASTELEAPEEVPQEDDLPRSNAPSEAATVDDMATAPIVEGQLLSAVHSFIDSFID